MEMKLCNVEHPLK